MYKDFWLDFINNTAASNSHIVGNCPICGESKRHFYGNIASGQWDCKKCQAAGNAWTFLRDQLKQSNSDIFQTLNKYGISDIQDVATPVKKPIKVFDIEVINAFCSQLSEEKKAEFAAERGLRIETLTKHRLGINKEGWYTLPIFDAEGRIRNIKSKNGKDVKSAVGGENLLFGVEHLLASEPYIFVNEGAWSAMVLEERGFRAVGLDGAGVLKDEQIELFRGKEVYLIPDNDEPGRVGMKRIAKKLEGIAESVQTITLPVAEKQDVRDFFKNGGTVDQFDELIKQSRLASVPQPSKLSPIPSYDEYINQDFPPVEFLIGSEEGGALLQKISITIIAAEFGKGKTIFTLGVAWAITKGEESFLGFSVKKGRGLYLIFEGGNSSFQKRLKVIGKGESNPDLFVKYIGHSFDLTPNGDKKTENQIEFENEIERLKVDFVVLDNAANVFSGDENDQKQVKPFMDYLHSVKEKFNVSFIILRHWKKTQQKGGSPRRQMATGSIWWLNAVDNLLCLSGDAENIILSSEKERNCGSFSPKVIAIDKESLRFRFVKDFASNGPRYTEENTLMPAWESFREAKVKQTDLIKRMTEIVQTDGKGCSERTAKKLLGESNRFYTEPVLPGSTKAGNWVKMKIISDDELFIGEVGNVS